MKIKNETFYKNAAGQIVFTRAFEDYFTAILCSEKKIPVRPYIENYDYDVWSNGTWSNLAPSFRDLEEELSDDLVVDTINATPPTMNISTTGGLRDNKGKARLSLVPASLEEAVAEVIFKSSKEGGGKYPMHNWRKGLPWTEVAESAMRHIKKFVAGEDLDTESGMHHLKHVATNIAFLIEYLSTHPELDNRFKGDK